MAVPVDKTAAQELALMNKPYEYQGLQFWGIEMRRYKEWAKYKNVWLSRQSTFPVFCVMMPFIDALFALDKSAIDQTGHPMGFLYSIMYCLGMALRMGENCVQDREIYLSVDNETETLKSICVKKSEYEIVEITSDKFMRVREIVAWMNGEDVPDETMNDDLLETERILSERSRPNLRYSLIDLEASVSVNCGVRIADILDWTILEFEMTRRAIDRSKNHLINAIGTTNGCKWEHGNPCPSWCYDRDDNGTAALISQSEFGKSKKK